MRSRHFTLTHVGPPRPPRDCMDTILVVNAGSSSVKFQVFAVDGKDRLERQLATVLSTAARSTIGRF